MLVLMLPLLAGIIFAKVRDNFNNIYILTHIDQPGVLMANDLGRKLFSTIQWLVPYALQIALFPFLCELVSKKDRQKLGDILSSSCRLLLAVFVPGAVFLALLAMPISILIFLGGKTGIELASWAGISTACYCLVLPAAAVECVLMQGSFADQKTVAVTVIGIASSMVSVLLSYLFIVIVGVEAEKALMVVALGFVLSRCLKSIALALYLRRSTPMFPARPTMVFLFKLALLAGAVGAVTWGVSQAVSTILPDGIDAALAAPDHTGDISRIRIALRLIVAAGAAGVTFLAAGFALRLEEPKQMIRWTIGKAIAKISRQKK
jgi:peptidoglycan biosynthesis protein MviN/MurJ (putative lipid II flippase)